ncbi:MAG: sigma-70 family RNA polymerase sigma factor [Labilithrix sp.]|nr:sigma-70 family RNA polymerase sigma factor [Labilithrix sp.]
MQRSVVPFEGGVVAPVSGMKTLDTPEPSEPSSSAEVYDQYFAFVWRTARRLGVAHDALDDIVQETFLVVHRRLAEPRTGALRPWIYGIVLHTVRNHRRSVRRKQPHTLQAPGPDPDALPDGVDGPERSAQKAEAAQVLRIILEELDDEKREVFVLVELEQLSVPEVAEVLAVKLNTVYSRLRLARAQFEGAVSRHVARDPWVTK